MRKFLFAIAMLLAMVACGVNNTAKSEITAEMAFEGVSNYCHSAYDWSVANELRIALEGLLEEREWKPFGMDW